MISNPGLAAVLKLFLDLKVGKGGGGGGGHLLQAQQMHCQRPGHSCEACLHSCEQALEPKLHSAAACPASSLSEPHSQPTSGSGLDSEPHGLQAFRGCPRMGSGQCGEEPSPKLLPQLPVALHLWLSVPAILYQKRCYIYNPRNASKLHQPTRSCKERTGCLMHQKQRQRLLIACLYQLAAACGRWLVPYGLYRSISEYWGVKDDSRNSQKQMHTT